MLLVGLTGGVATGKSTVARCFAACGAHVIDADHLAREVVEPGKPAWREIVTTYGKTVLHPDGTLDRARLAALVFGRPARLRRLNAIVHPRVARAQSRLTRAIAQRDPSAVVLYDVPLLFEAGVDTRVQRVVVVTADRATQIDRLRRRNGLSKAEALRRIQSQMPLDEKVRRADYVIDGTESLASIRRHVATIFGELKNAARRGSAPTRPRRRLHRGKTGHLIRKDQRHGVRVG